MNYLTEIREFYNWMECNQLSTSAICLWHALMHMANKSGWKEWFSVPVATLELKTGLSRSAIYRARNTLRQVGRIDFKDRSGKLCSMYRLASLVCHTDTQSGTQTDTQSGTLPGTQTEHRAEPLYKQNKTSNIYPYNPPVGDVEKKERKRFVKPTEDEVAAYCKERGNTIDAAAFVAFYDSNGWKVGKNPMKDWKAAIRTWEQKRKQEFTSSQPKKQEPNRRPIQANVAPVPELSPEVRALFKDQCAW